MPGLYFYFYFCVCVLLYLFAFFYIKERSNLCMSSSEIKKKPNMSCLHVILGGLCQEVFFSWLLRMFFLSSAKNWSGALIMWVFFNHGRLRHGLFLSDIRQMSIEPSHWYSFRRKTSRGIFILSWTINQRKIFFHIHCISSDVIVAALCCSVLLQNLSKKARNIEEYRLATDLEDHAR